MLMLLLHLFKTNNNYYYYSGKRTLLWALGNKGTKSLESTHQETRNETWLLGFKHDHLEKRLAFQPSVSSSLAK